MEKPFLVFPSCRLFRGFRWGVIQGKMRYWSSILVGREREIRNESDRSSYVYDPARIASIG
jgi:hypothetical protein